MARLLASREQELQTCSLVCASGRRIFQPETLMPALGLGDHAHGDQPLVRADALGDDFVRGLGVGRAEADGGFSFAIGSS